jgi:asparagine synthetase B (glutamine-hydrolysing)
VDFIEAREVGRFDALLDRAVARGLDGTHPGVFLSGGLDSISIAAVAADLTRRRGETAPHALSLGFPDPGCDERTVQQSVAQTLGLRMHLLDFHEATGPAGLLEQSIALNSRLSSPLLNTWAPAYLQLARGGAASGVRTIMTGSGGDEWLSVSPFLGADLLRSGRFVEFSRFLVAWRRSYRFSSPMSFLRSAFWTYSLRPLAGAALDTVAPTRWQRRRAHRATASDPSWVAPDPVLSRILRERAPRSLGASRPAHGFYFQEVRTGLDHPLTSLELEEQYQFGSWLGVRFHHPYWDADLVDMLYRTPPHLLNRGGRSKGLVRDTVARRFPSLGFERQRKVLATSFYRTVLFAEAPAVANRYGDCRTLSSLGVVDGKAAERMVRETLSTPHRDGQSSAHLHRVWDLLNLEAWARSRVAKRPGSRNTGEV